MSAPHDELAAKPANSGSGPKFSLIVSTCNRVNELERLLASLDRQSYKNFEVIVVDQNPDARLVPVFERFRGLEIHHLRSELGLSLGRNVGLRSCKGDLVSFPDDDCWFPYELLADIVRWLAANSEFDGVVTSIRNADHVAMAPKFPPRPGPCTRKSVLRCAVMFNSFLRRRVVEKVGLFREDLGVGSFSRYQSGEDLDYMIRSVDGGFRLSYQPDFAVGHPEMRARGRLRPKTYPYALGVGYVWRIHGYPWWWCFGEIVMRSLGGAVLHLCKADFEGSSLYLARAAGQLSGYLSNPKDEPAKRDVQPIVDDRA